MSTIVPLYLDSANALPKGTKLNGIFEIDRLIGAGGMGQVYRACALEAHEIVAIKVIKAEIARDQSLMGLLKKEANTLSKISHESIVKHILFSVDPQIGRPYLAMEFVEGPSLSDLIKDGPLSTEGVVVLLNRIGSGLDAIHRLGITHRDISPDNIILPRSDPGRAKLIDFGIARNHNGNETIIADRFAGKLRFASPEHLGLHGGNVTPKSDIYSFGLTLAAAMIGAPLNLGDTQVEMLRCRQTVPNLEKIDPRFRKVLVRMLQPEPSERPDTIAELTEIQESGSVVLPKRAVLAGPRKGWQSALVAFGSALIFGCLVGWYGITRSIGPEATSTAHIDPTPTESGDQAHSGNRKALKAEQPDEGAPEHNPQIGELPTRAPTQREESVQVNQQRDVLRYPEVVDPTPPLPRTEDHASAAPGNSSAVNQAEMLAPAQAPAPVAGTAFDPALTTGQSNRDCSTCPPLVELPGGTFSMGSTADLTERPAHLVHVRAFLMSRGPITVREWNACYTAGRCELKAEGAPDQPATNLSWDDAQQYVRWLSSFTQRGYRLPSEAEWEYAARGGTRTRFWWGDHFRSEMAPCRGAGSLPLGTAPAAASFPENPFGLAGTTCVVAQWVYDCWHKNYRGAPSDGSAWGSPNCKQRVLRGGTWRSRAEAERVTSRDFYDSSVRYPGNGVRIARDL